MSELDLILRSRPDLGETVLPAIAEIVTTVAGRKALIDQLATNPPWRDWLFRALPQASDPYAFDALLVAMSDAAAPLHSREIQPYLDQLVGIGQFEMAYLEWTKFLPQGQSQGIAYVFNASFELPLSGWPFDWSIPSVPGAVSEIVPRGDDEQGKALRVSFAGSRVGGRLARQLINLPPGNYRFSGQERAGSLTNPRGMTWRIRCASGDQVLAETKLLQGTVPWEEFSVDLTVPESCEAQQLTLELAARTVLEQQVAGQVWYDDLVIERVGVDD